MNEALSFFPNPVDLVEDISGAAAGPIEVLHKEFGSPR
jgi:hypothetical protein